MLENEISKTNKNFIIFLPVFMYYGIIDKVEMNKQKHKNIEFKKLDYAQKELIIQFRSVGFYTSFGTKDDFFEKDGQGGERYFDWLRSRNESEFSAFHVMQDKKIIGQLELNLLNTDKSIGYVNYYYLQEDHQGSGIAKLMDDFVKEYYQKRSISKMRLAVSPTNNRAYRFYEKCGWCYLEEKDYINKDGINLGHKIHILERLV